MQSRHALFDLPLSLSARAEAVAAAARPRFPSAHSSFALSEITIHLRRTNAEKKPSWESERGPRAEGPMRRAGMLGRAAQSACFFLWTPRCMWQTLRRARCVRAGKHAQLTISYFNCSPAGPRHPSHACTVHSILGETRSDSSSWARSSSSGETASACEKNAGSGPCTCPDPRRFLEKRVVRHL